MIPGLDSSLAAPSAAQAQAAARAGVPLWSGYLATRSGVGLLATWTQDAFDKARLAGCRPIGFCSGWDDPVAIRRLAAAYDVLACLDAENGIRPDGPWVPGWLALSGAGLYGNFSVHYEPGEPVGRGAAFNVGAAYPGSDPRATWPSYLPRPPRACGWQWWGTHDEFGVSVDRGWYDDWFLPSGPGRGGDTEVPMASGSSITIDGRLIVAALGQDGSIALASSTGGLGGLEAGTYLEEPTFTGDFRDVWLGQDVAADGVTKRLLVFAADGEGSVHGCPISLADFRQLDGWALVAGLARYARVPMYQGQALPPGPAAPGVDDQHIRDIAADEIQRRLANG